MYGLYKTKYQIESNKLLEELGRIPFHYAGDINKFDIECNRLINQYPNHNNFISNYFIVNKRKYFENQSLNYVRVPKDCRTNNFLENYNGYIKQKLGKNRYVNWMNFLEFIKTRNLEDSESYILLSIFWFLFFSISFCKFLFSFSFKYLQLYFL